MLDRTEQRILGVLVEKEATVPDIYPMSENALVDGCNQKNNRDPIMGLEQFMVAGALMALQEKGWIARIDGSSRVTKYRHKVVERLGVTKPELAILCELLLRGAQAPGALKPRVARLGYVAEPDAIEAQLQRLATRPQPLVEQLPLAPRERDRKWCHRLGPAAESTASPVSSVSASAGSEPEAVIARPPAPTELEARLRALESEVAELKQRLDALGG